MGFDAGNLDNLGDLGRIMPGETFRQADQLSREIDSSGLAEAARRKADAERAAVDSLGHLGRMADDIATLKSQTESESTKTTWILRLAVAALVVGVAGVLVGAFVH